MASISTDKQGNRRILFYGADGSRPVIHLGKLSLRKVEGIKRHVEELVGAQFSGEPIKQDTATWVADVLREPLRTKLVKVGLIAKREQPAVLTLAAHLDAYFAKRTDVKPGTLIHWRHAKRSLLAYFGGERPLSSITAGDARDWERWLKSDEARENRYAEREATDGLAPNTVRKRISDAKQFFQDAVDRDLLVKNPFAGLKGTVGGNRSRDFFVDRDISRRVIDACPDAEWRLLFALARFGGLRCPSEVVALKWSDIDWARGRMRIASPKTEHHEGHESREVPIFAELRPYLDAVFFDPSEDKADHVITRYRGAGVNLRTQLKRIIGRAGLEAWPKLWHNLRASRATELAAEHPAHVAAAWLGHSTVIASKHYWQVTDDDFTKATKGPLTTALNPTRAASPQVHAEVRSDAQPTGSAQEKPLNLRSSALDGELMQFRGVGDTGLEPVTPSLSSWCSSQLS